MSVIVFGSINMDLVVRTPSLPVAGETITGTDFFTAPGGKGANQAVACARLGTTTHMVGRVGNDVFSTALLESLRYNQVNTQNVFPDPAHPSGVALIAVDQHSENSIIIVPGANGAIDSSDVERLESLLEHSGVLLLQLEIPMDSVLTAARNARGHGLKVILDPAPAKPLPAELYELCDVITPNEIEAGILVGFPVSNPQDASRAASVLLGRGATGVVIKMGSKGAYFSDGSTEKFFQPFKVKAIDSVAAGDAFNGGLAVGLLEGRSLVDAIRWGMAAGALSTTKHGAQPSMPDRSAVEQMLIQQGTDTSEGGVS